VTSACAISGFHSPIKFVPRTSLHSPVLRSGTGSCFPLSAFPNLLSVKLVLIQLILADYGIPNQLLHFTSKNLTKIETMANLAPAVQYAHAPQNVSVSPFEHIHLLTIDTDSLPSVLSDEMPKIMLRFAFASTAPHFGSSDSSLEPLTSPQGSPPSVMTSNIVHRQDYR